MSYTLTQIIRDRDGMALKRAVKCKTVVQVRQQIAKSLASGNQVMIDRSNTMAPDTKDGICDNSRDYNQTLYKLRQDQWKKWLERE